MRLRTFEGASTSEVMRLIKQELGDEAVIVTSRTMDDGTIRVTAAIEEEQVPEPVEPIDLWVDGIEDQTALFSGIHDYGQLPDPDCEHKLDTIAKALTRHNVPGFLHEKIMAHAEQNPDGSAQDILARVFNALFSFDPISTKPYERPMMLVGQPGAGKTTTIAKLATRAVMNGLKPAVITADTTRAGGVEQLAAFMRVLQIGLIKVNNPEQLKQAVHDHQKSDQILIDCPGLNAFSVDDMKELHAYIKACPVDLIITLPGGMDMEESVEIARAFAVLGAKWILPTRLDMSRRLGGIIAAADQAGLSFVGVGDKPDIANGFADLDAAQLARLFLPTQTKE